MAGKIPSWLQGHLHETDLVRVTRAVQAAEAGTSAEIVPLIVRRSSVVGQVPMVVTLIAVIAGLLGLLAGREFLNDAETLAGVLAVFPLSLVLGLWLSRFEAVQRLTIPDTDEVSQVWRRARIEFDRARVRGTRHHSGVLIFVSKMERRAVILPDEGAASALPAEVCEKLVAHMASHLGRGDWVTAFETVIAETGEKLAAALPAQGPHENELGNDLLIKD